MHPNALGLVAREQLMVSAQVEQQPGHDAGDHHPSVQSTGG